MNRTVVQEWIKGYVQAWRSPGTAKLSELFSEDTTYRVSPWKQPIQGLHELGLFWEQSRSGPDEVFTFKSEMVAIEGTTAVARIEVRYEHDTPGEWRDIWVIKFNQRGLCQTFEEWPFSPEQDNGHNS